MICYAFHDETKARQLQDGPTGINTLPECGSFIYPIPIMQATDVILHFFFFQHVILNVKIFAKYGTVSCFLHLFPTPQWPGINILYRKHLRRLDQKAQINPNSFDPVHHATVQPLSAFIPFPEGRSRRRTPAAPRLKQQPSPSFRNASSARQSQEDTSSPHAATTDPLFQVNERRSPSASSQTRE